MAEAVPKKPKTAEENRVARQAMVKNILKADQNNPYAVLLLKGLETSNEAEERAKALLNKLEPSKCSGIDGAQEAAKSEIRIFIHCSDQAKCNQGLRKQEKLNSFAAGADGDEDMGEDSLFVPTDVKAPPPSHFRAGIYRQAEPLLEQLVQDPKSKDIQSQLTELNQQIIAQNKIDKVDQNQGTIDIPFFVVNLDTGRSFRNTVIQNPNDVAAQQMMVRLSETINTKAKQAGYPLTWERLLMSPAERMNTVGTMSLNDNPQPQAIDATPPPNHSQSKAIDLTTNTSSSGVQAPKDKTVSFETTVKQEYDDDNFDFGLKDQDYYSDDGNENVVEDDGEGPMTLRKAVPRGPGGEQGELEGWSKHREMEIIRYGSRNAPYYRCRYGTIEETEKTKEKNLGGRRGEDKNGTKWRYTGRDV